MLCHMIRKKIFSIDGFSDKTVLDDGVRNHLAQCPRCAALVNADNTLRRDFATVRSSDQTTPLALETLRNHVEARIALDNTQTSLLTNLVRNGGRMMNLAVKKVGTRPRLSVSLAVLAVLLLAAVTVPLNIGREMQYQVAFAAVDEDMMLNADALRQVLTHIDIRDANVDVDDCDPRCRVKVSNLKNLEEVRIVVAAVDQVGNLAIEDVSESSRPARSTLLQLAGENLFIEGDGTDLLERIKADIDERPGDFDLVVRDGSLNFWSMKEGSDGTAEELEKVMVLNRREGRSIITLTGDIDVTSEEWLNNASMRLYDPYGNEHVFYLDDPDHRILLAEMGFDFETLKWRNGAPEWPETIIDDGAESTDQQGIQLGNYPNPFNPSTVIHFSLPQAAPVDLAVYNIRGQKIRQLVNETMAAGDHSIEWDGKNASGGRVASGVYFYRLDAGGEVASRKMILTK